jgi:tetratricopeptide (TPR) repeat protein
MLANHRHGPRLPLPSGAAFLLILSAITPANAQTPGFDGRGWAVELGRIATEDRSLDTSASQTPNTTGSASGSPVPCDEMNVKARALVDSGKTEEARTLLTAAIQACAGAESRSDKERLAAALIRLGFIESTAQPREALEHFRRAMALDPENMIAPRNAGGMLISLGQYDEALEVLEKALKHGSDDKENLFGLEFNAGLALLKMCAARQFGCDPIKLEEHFVRASELNPTFPDTFFNLAAITNDIHHDSRRAMELFKKACDLGHKRACFQYDHFRSQIAALDRQAQGPSPTESSVEALAERIRQNYSCPAVVKSTTHGAEEGIVTWTVECSGNHVYTVIVGKTGGTTVIQKPR